MPHLLPQEGPQPWLKDTKVRIVTNSEEILLTRAFVCCLLSFLPAVNPSLEELVVHLLLLPGTLPLDHFYLLWDSETESLKP